MPQVMLVFVLVIQNVESKGNIKILLSSQASIEPVFYLAVTIVPVTADVTRRARVSAAGRHSYRTIILTAGRFLQD